jgi:hypothetical protein
MPPPVTALTCSILLRSSPECCSRSSTSASDNGFILVAGDSEEIYEAEDIETEEEFKSEEENKFGIDIVAIHSILRTA